MIRRSDDVTLDSGSSSCEARLLLNTIPSFQDLIPSHESKTSFHGDVLKMKC